MKAIEFYLFCLLITATITFIIGDKLKGNDTLTIISLGVLIACSLLIGVLFITTGKTLGGLIWFVVFLIVTYKSIDICMLRSKLNPQYALWPDEILGVCRDCGNEILESNRMPKFKNFYECSECREPVKRRDMCPF